MSVLTLHKLPLKLFSFCCFTRLLSPSPLTASPSTPAASPPAPGKCGESITGMCLQVALYSGRHDLCCFGRYVGSTDIRTRYTQFSETCFSLLTNPKTTAWLGATPGIRQPASPPRATWPWHALHAQGCTRVPGHQPFWVHGSPRTRQTPRESTGSKNARNFNVNR